MSFMGPDFDGVVQTLEAYRTNEKENEPGASPGVGFSGNTQKQNRGEPLNLLFAPPLQERSEALAQLARGLETSIPESLHDQEIFLVLLAEHGPEQIGNPSRLGICMQPLTCAGLGFQRELFPQRRDLTGFPTLDSIRRQLVTMHYVPYLLDSAGRLQHYRTAVQREHRPVVASQIALVAALLLEAGLKQALGIAAALLERAEAQDRRITELEHECTEASVERVFREQLCSGSESITDSADLERMTTAALALHTGAPKVPEKDQSTSEGSNCSTRVDGFRIKQLLRPPAVSRDAKPDPSALDVSTDQEFITAIMKDLDDVHPLSNCEKENGQDASHWTNSFHADAEICDQVGDSARSQPSSGGIPEAHTLDAAKGTKDATQIPTTTLQHASMGCLQAMSTPRADTDESLGQPHKAALAHASAGALAAWPPVSVQEETSSIDATEAQTQALYKQIHNLQEALITSRRQYVELREQLVDKMKEVREIAQVLGEYRASRESLNERESAMSRLLSSMEAHCEQQQKIIRMLQSSYVEAEMRAQQVDTLRAANEELSTHLLCMQARFLERDERIAELEKALWTTRQRVGKAVPVDPDGSNSFVTDQSSSRSESADAPDLSQSNSRDSPAVCTHRSIRRGHNRPELLPSVESRHQLPLLGKQDHEQHVRVLPPMWLLFYISWAFYANHYYSLWLRLQQCLVREAQQRTKATKCIVALSRQRTGLVERLERLSWEAKAAEYKNAQLHAQLHEHKAQLYRVKRLHQQSLWHWLGRLAPSCVSDAKPSRIPPRELHILRSMSASAPCEAHASTDGLASKARHVRPCRYRSRHARASGSER